MARPVRPSVAEARGAELDRWEPEDEPEREAALALAPDPEPVRSAEVVRIAPDASRDVELREEPPAEPDEYEAEPDAVRVAALEAPATGPDTIWWERALLSVVLSSQGDGDMDMAGLMRAVGPADFYEPSHEAVWQAIAGLWDDGVRPTPVAVMGRMGSAAHRVLPNGPQYLIDLVGFAGAHHTQAAQYAGEVREACLQRQIGQLGIRAQQIVADPDSTSEMFLGGLAAWMERVTAAQAEQHDGLGSALERVIRNAELGQAGRADRVVETPWADLDELLGGGLFPGQLVVVAARPGVGKTIMLENLGTHAARMADCETLFCSLEMTEVELVTRTLAWTATVPLNYLRAGGDQLTDQHWEKIAKAQPKIAGTHMTIRDESDQTVRSIRMEARRAAMAARRNGRRLAVVCVDYAGLLGKTNPRHDERQTINEATRELKKLAKELQCTVVLAAQLNRQASGRRDPRPILTDLKESGSLEQDADVVILLHDREEEDGSPSGDTEVLVPKQRNGPTGRRVLRKWGHYQTFRGIA